LFQTNLVGFRASAGSGTEEGLKPVAQFARKPFGLLMASGADVQRLGFKDQRAG
jgi:hypothetical protein